MKLTRYITKYDYELFINHNITLNEVLDKSSISAGPFEQYDFYMGVSPPKLDCSYKITIEIKENK